LNAKLKTEINPKILIYGYGNPGRQDDAAGVYLADEIQKWAEETHLTCIETDTNYQLNIEDVATISDKDLVVFADASREEIDSFILTELIPNPSVEFTMHHVSPSFVLHLCKEIYEKAPSSYLLHIKGYEWEFGSEMTQRSKENIRDALVFLKKFLLDYLSA
jgi:hydrogenase maturation protease